MKKYTVIYLEYNNYGMIIKMARIEVKEDENIYEELGKKGIGNLVYIFKGDCELVWTEKSWRRYSYEQRRDIF